MKKSVTFGVLNMPLSCRYFANKFVYLVVVFIYLFFFCCLQRSQHLLMQKLSNILKKVKPLKLNARSKVVKVEYFGNITAKLLKKVYFIRYFLCNKSINNINYKQICVQLIILLKYLSKDEWWMTEWNVEKAHKKKEGEFTTILWEDQQIRIMLDWSKS